MFIEPEDEGDFETFYRSLKDDLAPAGGLEELLFDKIIKNAWRLRSITRYESAVSVGNADTAVELWDLQQKEDRIRVVKPDGPWISTKDLASEAEWLQEDLQAVREEDPLAARPEICRVALLLASTEFYIPIEHILSLAGPWEEYDEYSKTDVEFIITYACEDANITEHMFWKKVEGEIIRRSEDVAREQERRRSDLERVRQMVSVPEEKDLIKIQRYESHLSRQFYRALHELQLLQATRIGLRPSVPLAVDIEINSSTSGGIK